MKTNIYPQDRELIKRAKRDKISDEEEEEHDKTSP